MEPRPDQMAEPCDTEEQPHKGSFVRNKCTCAQSERPGPDGRHRSRNEAQQSWAALRAGVRQETPGDEAQLREDSDQNRAAFDDDGFEPKSKPEKSFPIIVCLVVSQEGSSVASDGD